MKFTLFGLLSLAICCNVSSLGTKDVREAIFTQWVDHFNPGDLRTFAQVVYINDEHYQPGGPVLVFVSATSDTYDYWLENSHMVNIAENLNGVIYALEPRYFGRSYPTSDVSVDNLTRYLQINQSISDYVEFITFMKEELITLGSDKFVLIGHSRGGTLAQWIHHTNLGLVNGVWAVSAPFITQANFQSYYFGMWMNFIDEFPDDCQQTIYSGFEELATLVDNREIDRIREVFQFEADFNFEARNDVALFYQYLVETMFTPIEYGTRTTIHLLCDMYFRATIEFTPVELLGEFFSSTIQNHEFKYETIVSLLREDSLGATAVINQERQNLFVACNGWSQFKSSHQFFISIRDRIPFDVFTDMCRDVFAISSQEVLDGNALNNFRYAILSNITDIYFTNAELDPHWQIGVVRDENPSSPADFIPGIGKLFDFYRFVDVENDSDELQAVRARALQIITGWTQA